jgi:hypothetical protein
MPTPAPINLDKLRNAVQKFGAMSFTTSQIVTDYEQTGDPTDVIDVQRFEELLHRHAALLGIAAQPSSAGGDTVWQGI